MISDNLRESLRTLDFYNVPTMAQLRMWFLKLCIERHPDKGGEKDKFQMLLETKQEVSEYISSTEYKFYNCEIPFQVWNLLRLSVIEEIWNPR